MRMKGVCLAAITVSLDSEYHRMNFLEYRLLESRLLVVYIYLT